VQEVYKSQGVDIHDKHIELIVRQMLKKIRVEQKGDTDLLPGQYVDRHEFGGSTTRCSPRRRARQLRGDHPRHHQGLAGHGLLPLGGLLPGDHEGLTDAALEGKIDRLAGLKENVIIGKLIPAATGLKRYRSIEIEPAEPLPRGIDDVGLLEGDDLAAELGLGDGEGLQGFGPAFDTTELDEINAGFGPAGGSFDDIGELDVPSDGRQVGVG
jgi:DNA-directed RNA polymerase subunit beta'